MTPFFRHNNAADGKIRLDRISWYMPHVMPDIDNKNKLYKIIDRKETLQVGYRMIQCVNASVPQTTLFTWDLKSTESAEVRVLS